MLMKDNCSSTNCSVETNPTVPFYVTIYIVLFALSAIFGVFGNLIVILAGCSSKVLRDLRYAFIFNLAFADLSVSGVTMPMSIIGSLKLEFVIHAVYLGVLMGRTFFVQFDSLCKLSAVVCAPGCVASTYSICAIAISRYFYICKFNVYLKYFTKWRIAFYILLIWVLSFVVHMPNHVGWGMVRYSANFQFCTFDADHISYSMFYASFLMVAIFVTAIFYVKLYLTIRSSILPRQLLLGKKEAMQKAITNNTYCSEMSFRDEIRLVKASFKIFIVFLIFWAPVTVLILIAQADRIPDYLYLYSALAAHSNSALNVFIYYVENHSFRRAICSIFRRKADSSRSFTQQQQQSCSRLLPPNKTVPNAVDSRL